MRKRYLVLGFSLLLALVVAVPALGEPSDPTATTSASAKKLAKKALKKAKKADKRSKNALNVANNALDVANQALEQGGTQGPGGPPGPAGPVNLRVGQAVTIADAEGDLLDAANNPPANLPIQVNEGFAWALACGTAGPPFNLDPVSVLAVRNLEGGNDSHIREISPLGALLDLPPGGPDDFDEVEDAGLAIGLAPNATNATGSPDWSVVYGTAGGGTTQAGFGNVLNNPGDGQFNGDPDCVGSLNLLSP
jgi:hypothetical protein